MDGFVLGRPEQKGLLAPGDSLPARHLKEFSVYELLAVECAQHQKAMHHAFCLAYFHRACLKRRAVENTAAEHERHHHRPEPNADTPARHP
jgi:hypothetical protein